MWTEVARYGREIEKFTPPEQLLHLEDGVVKKGTEDFVFGLIDKGMQALVAIARETYPHPQDPAFSPSAFDYDKLSLQEFLAGVEMTSLERAMTSSFWATACQAPLSG